MNILLVDDDSELADLLKTYLEREGYRVTAACDGERGIAEALSGQYSLAVLDVMMSGVNGIEVLREIRSHSQMPVLMLTARGDDVDRIIGLELGAADYVPKPCTPRELAARIRAILRRTQGSLADGASEILRSGPLTLQPARRSALWKGSPLELTSTEFSLLEILARNAGRVVDKKELSEQALGRPLARFDRSIDVHMSSVRHKLGVMADGRSYILTVRGKGYQLVRD
ncbi:MAG: response regulator transcription factor [Methylococcaceae bacterium]|nr:response regulator transcription factor [Methylococcaceae bacterium]